MGNEIEVTIKKLKEIGIHEDWLDGIKNKIFNDKITYDKKGHQSSIKESIEECTSPKISENSNPFSDENLKLIFNAFSLFEPKETKVLIIGQDPYTDKRDGNKATGLAFIMNKGVSKNDSLYYILKAININNNREIQPKENISEEDFKNLRNWISANGILLLNTSLTYKKSKNNDKNEEEELKQKNQKLWKPFMQQVICNLLDKEGKLIVFLWGGDAQKKFIEYIDKKPIKRDLLVLSTSHPSPISYKKGFEIAAPNHFKICNQFLGRGNEINWQELLDTYC